MAVSTQWLPADRWPVTVALWVIVCALHKSRLMSLMAVVAAVPVSLSDVVTPLAVVVEKKLIVDVAGK